MKIAEQKEDQAFLKIKKKIRLIMGIAIGIVASLGVFLAIMTYFNYI